MPPKPPAETSSLSAPAAGASLDAWLAYLEALHPTEIDLGLDRVLIVFRKLFPRTPDARIVTVAGTNGKGSTVACLESLLLTAGHSVGAYTSPHLNLYNERVRINGADVSSAALVRAFERIEAARGSVSLTYFEFGTLAAFLVMAEAELDTWILEVGLGGRLDAVNVLDADLAILTSVDLDHTAWLGPDRESIGFEKAGILRAGRPAIYADVDPPGSVLQQARAQGVTLQRLGEDYQALENEQGITLTLPRLGRSLHLPSSPLPVQSVAAGVVAAIMLAPALSSTAITMAISGLSVPGRFERLRQRPDVYVDVGHNPHAARWLYARLARVKAASGGRIWAVYGCLADKDSVGVVDAMTDVVDHWMLCGLGVPRGLSATALSERLARLWCDGGPAVSDTVTSGLEQVLSMAAVEDHIIVFGSFYTVAQAREDFQRIGTRVP